MPEPLPSGLPDCQESRDLWSFISSEPIVIALETTVYLRRPAVEGIQQQLLLEFPYLVEERKWRRIVGKVIRGVLEARGYQLEAEEVTLEIREPFQKGATYLLRQLT